MEQITFVEFLFHKPPYTQPTYTMNKSEYSWT